MLNHWKIHSCSDFQDAINSIRRPTNDGERASNRAAGQWRQSSMTSFVLSPFTDARTCLQKAIFDGFWGNLNPKMLSAIVWTPKRHFLTSQRVLWAVVCQNPCTDHFSRWVLEKNKNKKERPYISRISPGAPLGSIGLRVRLMDVIYCAKFYRNRLRGLDSVRGQSLTIPIGLRCRC